jgi:hypothetical protein
LIHNNRIAISPQKRQRPAEPQMIGPARRQVEQKRHQVIGLPLHNRHRGIMQSLKIDQPRGARGRIKHHIPHRGIPVRPCPLQRIHRPVKSRAAHPMSAPHFFPRRNQHPARQRPRL